MAPAKSIEKPFLGSKNSFLRQNFEKGYKSEAQVLTFLEKKGCHFIKSRWRTPFAELDLVVEYQNKYWIIEVKSLSSFDRIENRLTWRQKQRLFRARQWLEVGTRSEVGLLLAIVGPNSEIMLFNEF